MSKPYTVSPGLSPTAGVSASGLPGRRVGNFTGNITGQGLTEYIIIVALIAIASIAAVSFFGQSVQGQFAGLAGSLAGNGAAEGREVAMDAADAAVDYAGTEKDLSNYSE